MLIYAALSLLGLGLWRASGYAGGTSASEGEAEVRAWLRSLRGRVTRVADFGTGLGKQGRLVRDELGSGVLLTGSDTWMPAIQRLRAEGVYNSVAEMDMRAFARVAPRGPGSLWIFGDVLEHLPKSDAFRLLNDAGPPEYVILRIPVGPYPQDANQNAAEAHLWTFYPNDLLAVTTKLVVDSKIIPLAAASDPRVRTGLAYSQAYETPFGHIGNFLLRDRRVSQ